MSPKRSHAYPYKREAEGGFTGKDDVKGKLRESWRCRPWRLERCGHKPQNAGSHEKLEEARQGMDSPLEPLKGAEALLIPWFCPNYTNCRFLASRTMRECIFVVLSHLVCGNLLQQPQETSTGASSLEFIIKSSRCEWLRLEMVHGMRIEISGIIKK